MGAEVIKIEPPGAPDPLRTWGQAELDGHHFFWTVHARNKKAVTLNLREAKGRELFLDLVERSDVIVENFRPGTLEKWNLGYDVLRERNRGIILVRVSGYGQTGPGGAQGRIRIGRRGGQRAAAHERLPRRAAATAGAVARRQPGGDVRRAGRAGRALPALRHRRRPGRRRRADRILFGRTGIHHSRLRRRRCGPRARRAPGWRASRRRTSTRRADGSWVVIAANQDTVFRRLCGAMGQPELATDDRFANHVARGRNQDELDKIIGDWAAERQPADIIATLSAAGVISGPINTVAEVVEDPQLQSRGMIADHWDERIGRNVKGPGVVPVLSETPGHHPQRRVGPARSAQRRGLPRAARQAPTPSSTRCGRRACYDRLPTHVDIRDVSLRDGLQIEEPIPLSRQARTARGRRRHRGAGDGGDGLRLTVEGACAGRCRRTGRRTAPVRTASSSPRWSPAPTAPSARSPRACGSIEYVVSAADGHSRSNVGRYHRRSDRADRRDRRDRARQRRLGGGHHRHRVGLPVRRPDPAAARARHRHGGSRHGVDRLAIADTIGTTTPRRVSDLFALVRPLIGRHPAGRALPQHPRRRPGQRVCGRQRGCHPTGRIGRRARRLPVRPRRQRQHRHRGSGVPVAGQRHSTSTSTCRPRSPRPGWRSDVVGHELPSSLLRAGDRILATELCHASRR